MDTMGLVRLLEELKVRATGLPPFSRAAATFAGDAYGPPILPPTFPPFLPMLAGTTVTFASGFCCRAERSTSRLRA